MNMLYHKFLLEGIGGVTACSVQAAQRLTLNATVTVIIALGSAFVMPDVRVSYTSSRNAHGR